MLVGNKLYDALQIFNKNNIHIIPLHKVNSTNNTKKTYGYSLLPKWEKTHIYFKEVLKALNKGTTGFAIQTGTKSGVFAVDWDNKETFTPELLQVLLDTNTLYVRTPSGGYHFYFKYNKLMSYNRKYVFNNIDIRSNGGSCFFGERSDGDYTLIDNEIAECPDYILKDLYQYHTIPTKKEIDDAPIKEVSLKYITKYNISTKSLLYLLGHLPDEYVEDFKLWYPITAVLKKADYYEAWNAWSKKATKKYHKKNNDYIWSKINTYETNNDLNYIVYLVNQVIKQKNKSADTFTNIEIIRKEYEVLSKKNIKKINKVINQKYLTTEQFTNIDRKTILLIQSGLGTGKTFNTFKWCIENNHNILSIVHLISLHDNQICNYNDMVNTHNSLNNTDISHITSYKDIFSHSANSICTTLNSLVKTLNFIDISEYYIYIDEVHRIVSYLLHSSTLSKIRRETFRALTRALKECKGIIGTDGDICDTTIQYLENIGLKINFIKNNYKSFDNVPVKFYNNHKVIKKLIKKCVYDEITFTLCCNTKKIADETNDFIKSLGVNTDNIKLYTSQAGDIVADVNEAWENNYIIYSPSIVEGVDRTATEPETVFVLVSSEKTIDPEQVKQQICRNRKIKEVYVGFNKMMNILDYNTIEDLKSNLTENISCFNNTFKQYLDCKMNTDGDDEYTDNYYSNLFVMSSFRNNVLVGNFKYTLKQILTRTGFVINDDWENDRETVKDVNMETTEVMSINEEMFLKYINGTLNNTNKTFQILEQRRSICNIPLNDIVMYKEIFTQQTLFNIYLNIRQLIKHDVLLIDKLKKDIDNEYLENYHKNTLPVMIKYKAIMAKYFPNMDIYNYNYTEIDDGINEPIEIDDVDFKYIMSQIRSKKKKPETKKQFLKLMNMYIKNFYGKDMVEPKQKTTRDTEKVKSHYIYTFNNRLFNHFIDLNKYSINYENITHIDTKILESYNIIPYGDIVGVPASHLRDETDTDNEGSIIVDDD